MTSLQPPQLSGENDVPTVTVCPICSSQNDLDATRCGECFARMAGVAVVSKREADELARRRYQTKRRWQVVRWGVAMLVVLVIGAWVAYENIGTTRFLPPPTSNISADVSQGDWPMAMRDPGHSAVAAVSGRPIEGKLKWRFETDEPIFSSPAVVGDRVFLSTGDRRIVVLNAETGRIIWECSVNGPVNSSPAVAGDLVFVGLRDGTTLSLDAETGEHRWQYVAGERGYSSPAVMDGVVYFGSGDRILYALDAITGDVRWTYEATDTIFTGPAVNHEVVAVTSADGVLHIVDVDTGNRRLDVLTQAMGAPVLLGDRVYVADHRGMLLGVDWHKRVLPFEKGFRWLRTQFWAWGISDSPPTAKGIAWVFVDFDSSFIGAPVLAHDKLYAATQTGHLVAVDRDGRNRTWTFDVGAQILASPSVVGNLVLVGDSLGILHAVDVFTGDKLWEFETEDRIVSTPVFAHGTIYVTSWDGSLYAIE